MQQGPFDGVRERGGPRWRGHANGPFYETLAVAAKPIHRVARTMFAGVRAPVLAVLMAGMATGCATPPPADDPEAVAAYEEANDPMEPLNRVVFEFNITLDRFVLRPIAFLYKEGTPRAIKNMIRAFLNNLETPVVLANDVLQWEWDRAGTTMLRFAMNSSFGFGGIADIANDFGFPRHGEDFGQTLAVYGLGSGPYLMLPFLGPSTPRDAFGMLVDIAFDPLTYFDLDIAIVAARKGTDIVSIRARNYDVINDLERTSLDYYATVRSLYWQKRKDEILNGRTDPARSRKEDPVLFPSPDADTAAPDRETDR